MDRWNGISTYELLNISGAKHLGYIPDGWSHAGHVSTESERTTLHAFINEDGNIVLTGWEVPAVVRNAINPYDQSELIMAQRVDINATLDQGRLVWRDKEFEKVKSSLEEFSKSLMEKYPEAKIVVAGKGDSGFLISDAARSLDQDSTIFNNAHTATFLYQSPSYTGLGRADEKVLNFIVADSTEQHLYDLNFNQLGWGSRPDLGLIKDVSEIKVDSGFDLYKLQAGSDQLGKVGLGAANKAFSSLYQDLSSGDELQDLAFDFVSNEFFERTKLSFDFGAPSSSEVASSLYFHGLENFSPSELLGIYQSDPERLNAAFQEGLNLDERYSGGLNGVYAGVFDAFSSPYYQAGSLYSVPVWEHSAGDKILEPTVESSILSQEYREFNEWRSLSDNDSSVGRFIYLKSVGGDDIEVIEYPKYTVERRFDGDSLKQKVVYDRVSGSSELVFQRESLDITSGLTLSYAALHLNTTVDALLEVNSWIKDKDFIPEGRKLYLPDGITASGKDIKGVVAQKDILDVSDVGELEAERIGGEELGVDLTWNTTGENGEKIVNTITTRGTLLRTILDEDDNVTRYEHKERNSDGSETVIHLDSNGEPIKKIELSQDGEKIAEYTASVRELDSGETEVSYIERLADSEFVEGINKYGRSLVDAISFVSAIKEGKPLPIATSGIKLADSTATLLKKGNHTLKVADTVASGVNSLLSLDAALEQGDTLGAITSGASAVGYGAKAYSSLVGGSELANEISGSLLGSGSGFTEITGSLEMANGVVPYLNLVNSIAKGDAVGTVSNALMLFPGTAPFGAAIQVIAAVVSLFDKQPDPWGTGRYRWSGTGITIDATGETGGEEAVEAFMGSVLEYMNNLVEQVERHNPGSSVGLIPTRMPTLGYGTDGYRFSDIDPLTGEEHNAEVRYGTDFRPYNAPAGTEAAFRSLSEAFITSALERQAIAPMWEVRTAALQATKGDPKAGLSEEERAGRDGKLAAPVTGDSQKVRPVLLDLGGDGIEILKGDNRVYFDVDDSGFFKATEWVGPNDALLTIDRNYNGTIDSGKELFSNATVALSRRGLKGMFWVDSNYDGKLTEADPIFAQMKVWQDANSDGVENAGEVRSLSDLGITELNYSLSRFTQNGVIKHMASPDLVADTAGTRVNVVENGIIIETTDGGISLLVTRIDDLTAVEANADGVHGYEDTELIVLQESLVENDTLGGFTGRDLTITGVSDFKHGTAYLDEAGRVHFNPESNYAGNEAGFTYTIVAENGQESTGRVIVTLENVNDAPAVVNVRHDYKNLYGYTSKWVDINAHESERVYTPQYAPYYTPHPDPDIHRNVLHDVAIEQHESGTGRIVATDAEGDTLHYEITGLPQGGGVTIDSNGNFQYTSWKSPNTPSDPRGPNDEIRKDSFEVTITDGNGGVTKQIVEVDHWGPYKAPTPGGGKKPIAVDLDGDGFEFTSLDDSNIFFDVNGDGWKRRTAWTDKDDGLIVYDRDGNGTIDNGYEIGYTSYSENAQTDLEGVRAFDTNGDGVLSSEDAEWSKFGVWRDHNQNGVTDEGELISLEDMGVASIALTSDEQFQVINGQTVHGVGEVTMEDGSTLQFADTTIEYSDEVLIGRAVTESSSDSGSGTSGGDQSSGDSTGDGSSGNTDSGSEGDNSGTDGSADGGSSEPQTTTLFSPFSPSGELLEGTADSDLVIGKNGNNIVKSYEGDDVIFEDGGNDYIEAGEGDDQVYSGADNDVVLAGAGRDAVYSGLGNDMVFGEDGNDGIFTEHGNDIAFGGAGDDLISGGTGHDVLSGDAGNDVVMGESGNDALFGREGNDKLYGLDDHDRLDGGVGRDHLDGGAGDDAMFGGEGNDTYIVDSIGDEVTELQDQGLDSVHASINYQLGEHLENLHLLGEENLSGQGNALDNKLFGNSANNTLQGGEGDDLLDGKAGADQLVGGTGDDTYYVDNAADVVVEALAEGDDTVISTVDHSLAANVETLILEGDTAVTATGNALDNRILANAADNVLTGGAGDDVIIAGDGADVTVFSGNVFEYDLIENEDGTVTVRDMVDGRDGTDTVSGSEMMRFGDRTFSTEILLNQNMIGTDASELIRGRNSDDNIAGFGGDDIITGGVGNDTLRGNEGNDEVYGNGGDDFVSGDDGNDYLDGGAGRDEMRGGDGNDLIQGGLGDDRIRGDAGDDLIAGGAGNDRIYGDAGTDTAVFSGTRESYLFDALNNGSIVVQDTLANRDGQDIVKDVEFFRFSDGIWSADELFNGGNGSVVDGSNPFAGANDMQNLLGETPPEETTVYTSGDDSGHYVNVGAEKDIITLGNGRNTVYAGDGSNEVTTGDGQDEVTAGSGNDFIYTNAGYDQVDAGEGNNIVDTGEGYGWIESGAGKDHLTVGDNNSDIRSGAGDDVITAGDGVDHIEAGAGDNQVVLGAGDDRVVGTDGDDIVRQASGYARALLGEGNNTVSNAVDNGWVETGSGNDNISLNGSGDSLVRSGAGDDIISVGNGRNNIEAGEGNNEITSGDGDDTIRAGSGNDWIIAGDGRDRIYAGDGNNLITGGDGYAYVQTGNGNDRITLGNEGSVVRSGSGDDVIVTGDGRNSIEAGEGNNVVITGNGDDSIRTLAGNDSISSGDGNDRVYAGKGNDQLSSGAGNDYLYGDEGNDVLSGGSGNDYLYGEEGNDTYSFGRGDGTDWVYDYERYSAAAQATEGDRIEFGEGIASNQLWFKRSGSNLNVSIIGTDNSVTVSNWFSGDDYKVEEFVLNDDTVLMANQVDQLVNAMASFNVPAMGETELQGAVKDELQPVITAAWQAA